MKHLFVINPVAGGIRGRLEETEAEIRKVADSLGDPYRIYETVAPMEVCRVIAEEADEAMSAEPPGLLRVYACGGDGTLNECANGAAGRANVAITLYPCGTGNDFIRTFGAENVDKFRDLRALTVGTVRPLDLIDCGVRYGINICSVGLDARVAEDVHKYSHIPVIGGATAYVLALAINIIRGVGQKFKISAEGKDYDRAVTLVCACNGRFYGGGFNPVQDAMPHDGVLEYLIVNAVSRIFLSSVVGKFAKGRFREIGDHITYIRGGSMEIGCDREFVVNIDGETIRAEKIYFNVVPNGINFIFPPGIGFFDSDNE